MVPGKYSRVLCLASSERHSHFKMETDSTGSFKKAYNWEDEDQQAAFLESGNRIITTPNGTEVSYQEVSKVAVGLSKLGTSEAVEIGAYRVGVSNLKRQTGAK